jgi:hypothetical protein
MEQKTVSYLSYPQNAKWWKRWWIGGGQVVEVVDLTNSTTAIEAKGN